MTLRENWDEQAEAWTRFARMPGHDPSHDANFGAFVELLPPPGRRTLDVGCGEGRVGAELERRGYQVVGVDSSGRMIERARERHEAIVADATALPFADADFDLVIAYMSLMNMDDLPGAVREAARVLEPGGLLCAAVVHPTFAAAERDEAGRLVLERYFDAPTKVWEDNRDGIRMVFHDRVIPLQEYSRAFEAAGLLLDRVREVASQRRPSLPLFLHLRGAKPPARPLG